MRQPHIHRNALSSACRVPNPHFTNYPNCCGTETTQEQPYLILKRNNETGATLCNFATDALSSLFDTFGRLRMTFRHQLGIVEKMANLL